MTKRHKTQMIVLAGIAAAVAIFFTLIMNGQSLESRRDFASTYLWIWLFWTQLSLGSFFLMLILSLTTRATGEFLTPCLMRASAGIPFWGLLFIPLCFQVDALYPSYVNSALHGQRLYFSPLFFTLRFLAYFILWTLSFLLYRRALQRADAEPLRFKRTAAFALICHVLLSSLAAIDWIMALEPGWRSTAIGFLFLASQLLAATALAALGLIRRIRADGSGAEVRGNVGLFLLSAVIFWVYLAFCNYLIAWYGNLPERVIWYVHRNSRGWQWYAWLQMVFQVAIPFVILLPKKSRENLLVLGTTAALILLMRMIDMFWMTIPSFRRQGSDLTLWDGLGFLIAAVFWIILYRKILPLPRPGQSQEGIA